MTFHPIHLLRIGSVILGIDFSLVYPPVNQISFFQATVPSGYIPPCKDKPAHGKFSLCMLVLDTQSISVMTFLFVELISSVELIKESTFTYPVISIFFQGGRFEAVSTLIRILLFLSRFHELSFCLIK